MKKKHNNILQAIFTQPTRKNISWTNVEKLIKALGGDIVNKAGSVVTFRLNGNIITFHNPHPQKEIKIYMIQKLRKYLIKCDIL